MLTFHQFLSEASYGGLEDAKGIIKTLRTAGYQAYLVGGCVRDTLLGRKPKDFDVATDARPDEVLKLFPHADKVGAHFGVVIEKGVEIATFRSDGAYGDGRRPDSVQYEKSAREDAARRDFTVNAMFLDPFSGHVLDFFGGQGDIKHKTLRAVGDPYKRFHEDHLRMLRAMRFAAKLGFSIEPDTLAAMKGLAPHIKGVAPERVTQEITGALTHPAGAVTAFRTMLDTGLLSHIVPELAHLDAHKHQITHATLDHLHDTSAELGLAAMFSQVDPKAVPGILKRLKVSNDERNHVLGVLSLQPRITEAGSHSSMDVLKKLMRDSHFSDALRLYGSRIAAHDPHARVEPFQFLTKLFSQMKHEDLHPAKLVTGDDLISLGMRPGKEFKDVLDRIEIGQLVGHIHSKQQALDMIRSGQL